MIAIPCERNVCGRLFERLRHRTEGIFVLPAFEVYKVGHYFLNDRCLGTIDAIASRMV